MDDMYVESNKRTCESYWRELNEALKAGKVKERHTSLHSGYVRKSFEHGYVMLYRGRFGSGYKILTHNPNSTRYCYVTYYTYAE